MSKDQKTTEHQLEQAKSPAQRAVLDAIDLPELTTLQKKCREAPKS